MKTSTLASWATSFLVCFLILLASTLPAYAVPNFNFGPGFAFIVLVVVFVIGLGTPAVIALVVRHIMRLYQPEYSAKLWYPIALTGIGFWTSYYVLDKLIVRYLNIFSSYSGTSNTVLGWAVILTFAVVGALAGYYKARALKPHTDSQNQIPKPKS